MPKSKWIILGLILFLGIALRIVQSPPSLNWDEVSLGYNAYSLLKTGRDEWEQILPMIFRAYGDYKLPVFVYLAVVTQDVRLVSIIAGVLTILVMYILSRNLWAALIVAIVPWSVFLSRIAVEANVGILLISLGLCCLLSQKYTRAILFFVLSAWTYNAARIFAPLFLISYLFFNKKLFKLSAVSYLLLLLFINPAGFARYQSLSLLDAGAISKINELRQQPGGRLIYNKVTYFVYSSIQNYFSYLSPKFLFTSGGTHYQFSIPKTGLIYLSLAPFAILGLIKNRKNWWMWLWLVLAPIPGSITRDSPHVLRAMSLFLILIFLIASGLSWVSKNKKVVTVLIIFILTLETINYLSKIKTYNQEYSQSWQYGHKQVVQFIKQNYSKYDEIIFSKRYGEAHEFVVYYWPWNPADYQQNKEWDYHANWYWVNGLAKFRFENDWEIKDKLTPNSLVVYSPENEGPGREVFRVNFLDNKPAFIIKEL